MATNDHKARSCPFVSPGQRPRVLPTAGSPATCLSAASLRLSTLDDVALALYALAQLCQEDERHRLANRQPGVPSQVPLPPLFRQGVAVAMQCLEQYARQLGDRRPLNA
ncbi:hypothetical protein SAMN04487785_10430 [Dyella jiangningensis]|nr:hypothetical protein SAMN04487785_10430 [Dyella jiangningensis]